MLDVATITDKCFEGSGTKYGDTCEAVCAEGYQQKDGSRKYKCGSDDDRTEGVWLCQKEGGQNFCFHCEKTRCNGFAADNSTRKEGDYGTSETFDCRAGWEYVGGCKDYVCAADHTWRLPDDGGSCLACGGKRCAIRCKKTATPPAPAPKIPPPKRNPCSEDMLKQLGLSVDRRNECVNVTFVVGSIRDDNNRGSLENQWYVEGLQLWAEHVNSLGGLHLGQKTRGYVYIYAYQQKNINDNAELTSQVRRCACAPASSADVGCHWTDQGVVDMLLPQYTSWCKDPRVAALIAPVDGTKATDVAADLYNQVETYGNCPAKLLLIGHNQGVGVAGRAYPNAWTVFNAGENTYGQAIQWLYDRGPRRFVRQPHGSIWHLSLLGLLRVCSRF